MTQQTATTQERRPAAAQVPAGPRPLEPAQWWRRLLGFVIDAVILTLVTGALWGRLLAGFASRIGSEQAAHPHPATPAAQDAFDRVLTQTAPDYLIVLSFTICVAVCYFWLLPGYFGATIGNRSLGTRVVRAGNAGQVGLPQTLLRAVVLVVGAEVIPLFLLIDGLWLCGDRYRQCLHDKAAGVVVVNRGPRLVTGPVPVARADQRSRPHQPGALPERGRHDPHLLGEGEPGMQGQVLLQRLEQQRPGLGKTAADRHDLEVAQVRRRRDRDPERPPGPAQRRPGHGVPLRRVASQVLGRHA